MEDEQKKLPWWLEALGWGLFASVGWQLGTKGYERITKDDDDKDDEEED